MRTFEAGKRYGDEAVVFEVLSRTAKTMIVAAVHHAGRSNEKVKEPKKVRVSDWGDREVFITGHQTVEA